MCQVEQYKIQQQAQVSIISNYLLLGRNIQKPFSEGPICIIGYINACSQILTANRITNYFPDIYGPCCNGQPVVFINFEINLITGRVIEAQMTTKIATN